MEDNSAFSYQKEKSFSSLIFQILFSHVGLLLLVAGYAAFGAYAFVELEKTAEAKRYEDKMYYAKAVMDIVDVNTGRFWAFGDKEQYNLNMTEYKAKVEKDLKKMEKFVINSVGNHNYDGNIETWDYEWTFLNCLLLTMSILTTIGYGHIAPKTFEGQMFCIVYALVGCPIFLVFLANIGDAMAKGFIYIYSRMCCRPFRSRRYLEEVPDGFSKKLGKMVMDDVVGDEPYMPTSKMFVPITLSIVTLHAFMITGGVLFSYWEGWDLWSSFYFTFVTLSTIGYGDLVPTSALLETGTLTSTMKMLVAVAYIFLGMAMLTMCITLMQEQIVMKCKWVAQKVGFSKKDAVEPAGQDLNDMKRKDSLMPIMESKGRAKSPFRRPSSPMDMDPRGPDGLLPGTA